LIHYGIDIAVFDAVCCPISSVTAMNRIAPLMVHLDLGGMIYHSQIDHHVLPGRDDYSLNSHIQHKASVIPLGCDFHNKLKSIGKMTFKDIDESVVKIGSVGHLHKMANNDFINIVGRILAENPNSYFLFAGMGSNNEIEFILNGIAEYLHSAQRVKYVGFLKEELPSFILSLDLCLNTYPMPGGTVTLEIMAAGVPIVSLVEKELSAWNSVYDNIGIQDIIFSLKEKHKFYEGVRRLINDVAYKKEMGKKLQERYFNEFTYAKVTKKHETLYLSLYEDKLTKTNLQ